jgi:hypothetical protein
VARTRESGPSWPGEIYNEGAENFSRVQGAGGCFPASLKLTPVHLQRQIQHPSDERHLGCGAPLPPQLPAEAVRSPLRHAVNEITLSLITCGNGGVDRLTERGGVHPAVNSAGIDAEGAGGAGDGVAGGKGGGGPALALLKGERCGIPLHSMALFQ